MLIKTKQERILRLVKEAVERDNITEAAACRALNILPNRYYSAKYQLKNKHKPTKKVKKQRVSAPMITLDCATQPKMEEFVTAFYGTPNAIIEILNKLRRE